jgi:protein-disulfide isomerase
VAKKSPAPVKRPKRYAPFVIVALVLAGAIAGAAALYQSHRQVPLGLSGVPGAEPPHVAGSGRARVVVEEFGDFQCPPCGTLATILEDLGRETPGEFRLVFREYPLAVHKNAVPAAYAAEAAGLQGRFWEMHHLLYQSQKTWSDAADPHPFFEQFASKLGLNIARFKADVRGEQVKARVAADQKRATSLGVDRTPNVFVNSKHLTFTQVKPEVFRDAIKAAGQQAK